MESTTSFAAPTTLLKTQSFLVFQITQIKASQTIKKPFLIFLFPPLLTSRLYDVITSPEASPQLPTTYK
jgi:hypothetical protein